MKEKDRQKVRKIMKEINEEYRELLEAIGEMGIPEHRLKQHREAMKRRMEK